MSVEFEQEKPNCQSCWHRLTEQLTPIWEGDDGPSIHGLDYQYRCKIHGMIVRPENSCPDFELPF